MVEFETKEVSVVKQQATKALTAAETIVIASNEDMKAATDMLSKIKSVGKMIKERKEAITKPMMEALASARDLFKPIESNLADAERIVKRKMLDFQSEADEKVAADRLKIAQKVEKGTMKAETAVAKMEGLQGAPKAVQGSIGSVRTSIIKKYRVIDESKLPREYLIPNMPKITQSLKDGFLVPGAEMYQEKVINAR